MNLKSMAKQYMMDRMKRNWRGCWLWQGARNTNGYAYINFTGWRQGISIHRMAMHLWKNFDLESELYVCHTCDVRHCFNPRHLWLGTQSENIVDGFIKGRMDRGEHHANAKLKNKDVFAILRAIDKGRTQEHIAKKYGIAGSAITKIKQGKSWHHIWKEHYGKTR